MAVAPRYRNCIERVKRAAGHPLTDAQIEKIFERVHKAALDLKNGRAVTKLSNKQQMQLGWNMQSHIEAIALEASEQMKIEAAQARRQAAMQLIALGGRKGDYDGMVADGIPRMEAIDRLIARRFDGKSNIESLEQHVEGIKADLLRKLQSTWDALGNDFMGFFQDQEKLTVLIRELRGEDTGDALAKRGAKAFHDTAELARETFNAAGGHVGHLEDWGFPQHHSQERVAQSRDAWVNDMMPLLDRSRYVDEAGVAYTDAQLRAFLEGAWTTIATDGANKIEPGAGRGSSRANRHAESRQIHYKDAESVIGYWGKYGERTAFEILQGHIETLARDVGFIEKFGPNPNTTFRTLKDLALQDTAKEIEAQGDDKAGAMNRANGDAQWLDRLWNYASGNTPRSYRPWLSKTADAIANLNIAGKLGGAALASLFGDKPTMEAVMHLNNVPALQRWGSELSLLNPLNTADRRLIQQQGLMLDAVRSGLQRFYDGLGQGSATGKVANATMRITGMSAINAIRKAAAGVNLMGAIGAQLHDSFGRPVPFSRLVDSDVRMLTTFGVTPTDWATWQLAPRQKMAGVDNALTPEAIAQVPDDALRAAGVIGASDGPSEAAAARQRAIVKLLGVVNTESEFAIVTPGWRERAQFHGGQQRGTAVGELTRSVLQFKSFPWAMFQRGMDLVANAETPVGKTAMGAYLIIATTLAGAMLMQTREMLSGKDPRHMFDERDWYKFWAAAFLQGGALGIYGDLIGGAGRTRYGTGVLEVMAGPTVGPLLETGLTGPIEAVQKEIEGKDSHYLATVARNAKGFVPGSNAWYAKAALDHLVWMQVMEQLSPGYLRTMRQKALKDHGQDWYWTPGETTPDRPPDVSQAFAR